MAPYFGKEFERTMFVVSVPQYLTQDLEMLRDRHAELLAESQRLRKEADKYLQAAKEVCDLVCELNAPSRLEVVAQRSGEMREQWKQDGWEPDSLADRECGMFI